MKQLSLILLFVILVGAIFNVCNASEDNENKTAKLIELIDKLQSDQKLTKEALQEVRQGQLNYRIAKDLLKDTYSSNTQTINIVIMIVLGVITIIGFLGVKNISSIKRDFQKELDELKKLREKYEQKFTTIEELQNESKGKLEEMQIINKKQEQRLQVLEIQEKAGTLIRNKDYTRAMEYIEIGLSLNPEDIILLNGKADCLARLSNIPGAIQCYEEILKIDPDDHLSYTNLTEFYLMEKDIQKAEKMIEEHKQMMIEKRPNFIIWYFDLLKLYIKDDLTNMKHHIDKEIIQSTEGKTERINDWNFTDLRREYEKDNESSLKSLLFTSIEFLEGKIDVSALNKIKSGNGDTS